MAAAMAWERMEVLGALTPPSGHVGRGREVGGGPSGSVLVCASPGFVFSVPFFSIS